MLKNHSAGDNVTLLNTIFFRTKDIENNKFKDNLSIIYKDCDTGLKYIEEIEDPDYEYYMIHEDKRANYNRLFVSKNDVDKISVPFRDLEKDIAKRLGKLDFFYENIRNNNRSENRKLHMHPDLFNSDTNIEDHYRFRFDKLYKNEPFMISKSYFDIEVDSINMEGDFPQLGECPINAITIINQEQQQVFTFLLKTKSNPQIIDFENSVKNGSIFKEIESFVIDAVGGQEMAEYYNINFKYNFLFYEEENEILLIKDLFNLINNIKPDFVLAWNMAFDIPYILNRIINLGYDPKDIMCHPDFKNKIADYYIDERNKNEFAERGDFALISSYSVFLDQMIQFASRRKGQTQVISFSLDFIGELVAKVKKLDYKNITTNISKLPYVDYKTFVFYNIMDTVVQYCIEKKTTDIDFVFNKSLINNTRYPKLHRQTVYLSNRACKDFYYTDEGYIIGNNANKYNQKPTEKFPGAFVADSTKVNDYSKLTILGRPVEIYDNLNDEDYSSLYPSTILQNNIAPNTMIGMVKIPNQVFENENKGKLEHWTRAGKFMEDFQSQVWLEICTRWFHLSDYTKLYFEVIEFFKTKMSSYNGLKDIDTVTGLMIPMIDVAKENYIEGMIFDQNPDKNTFLINPILNNSNSVNIPNLNKWEDWRINAISNPNQSF